MQGGAGRNCAYDSLLRYSGGGLGWGFCATSVIPRQNVGCKEPPPQPSPGVPGEGTNHYFPNTASNVTRSPTSIRTSFSLTFSLGKPISRLVFPLYFSRAGRKNSVISGPSTSSPSASRFDTR